jgi:hypothetical protein
VEEFLLSGSPGEFLLTVNAGACLVFKLTHFFLPSYADRFLAFFRSVTLIQVPMNKIANNKTITMSYPRAVVSFNSFLVFGSLNIAIEIIASRHRFGPETTSSIQDDFIASDVPSFFMSLKSGSVVRKFRELTFGSLGVDKSAPSSKQKLILLSE